MKVLNIWRELQVRKLNLHAQHKPKFLLQSVLTRKRVRTKFFIYLESIEIEKFKVHREKTLMDARVYFVIQHVRKTERERKEHP